MSKTAEGFTDLSIATAATVTLLLIWVHVARPAWLKRAAICIFSTVFALAAGLWVLFAYAAIAVHRG